MPSMWSVLIVSSSVEDRKDLIRILDRLPLNLIVAPNLHEAADALRRHHIDFAFCHATLPDGSYRNLLSLTGCANLPIAVSSHSWDREAHTEALQQGAFATLRCPLQPTDVELVVIRASRHARQSGAAPVAEDTYPLSA